MGAIANVTEDGFGPSGFHAYPSTLRIDGYSGDYGPGFFGHAVNAGTYVVRHPEFGWVAFGGNLTVEGDTVRVRPLDGARSRVYLAPWSLWLTLEAGEFESVEIRGSTVLLTLAPAAAHTRAARLRFDQATQVSGVARIAPTHAPLMERGALLIPLSAQPTTVNLDLGSRP
jgi:hypothetical protein